MDAKAASRLGAVALGLGIAMAAGTGIAAAAPADGTDSSTTSSDAGPTTKSTSRQENSSDDSKNAETGSSDEDDTDDSDDHEADAESADTSETNDHETDTDAESSSGNDDSEAEAPVESSEPGTATVSDEIISGDDSSEAEPTTVSLPADSSATETEEADAEVATVSVQSASVPDTTDVPATGAFVWFTAAATALQRQLEYFFHGGVAVASDPRSILIDEYTGVLTGSLHAIGDERDRLVYRVIEQPKYGNVSISADGTYVYTPTSVPAEGIQDSFAVAIRNFGFNLPTLRALFNPRLNTTSVTAQVGVPALKPPPLTGVGSTRGFNIRNLSAETLKLTGVLGDQNIEGGAPATDFELHPGETLHLEVIYKLFTDVYVQLVFEGPDNVAKNAILMVTGLGNTETMCQDSGGNCQPTAWTGTNQLAFLDPVGTVVEIAPDDVELQALVFNHACSSLDPVTRCTFDLKRRDLAYSDSNRSLAAESGDTNLDVEQTVIQKLSAKSSIGVSVKVGSDMLKYVSLEVSEAYSHEITQEHEYAVGIKLTVPPKQLVEVWQRQPVFHYIGDFTVRMGNTTLYLRDVYLEEPDTSGQRGTISTVEVTPLQPTADGM